MKKLKLTKLESMMLTNDEELLIKRDDITIKIQNYKFLTPLPRVSLSPIHNHFEVFNPYENGKENVIILTKRENERIKKHGRTFHKHGRWTFDIKVDSSGNYKVKPILKYNDIKLKKV